jgi:hypothetical protein
MVVCVHFLFYSTGAPITDVAYISTAEHNLAYRLHTGSLLNVTEGTDFSHT